MLTNRIQGLSMVFFLVCMSIFFLPAQSNASDGVLVVAAANSTCDSLQQVVPHFVRDHGVAVEFICKSSGRLAKGLIGKSIQADFYISANESWMDKVISAGLIDRSLVRVPWGNSLIVAGPRSGGGVLTELSSLTSSDIHTIMIGDPSTAPFGRYAKNALSESGLWEKVLSKITTRKHISLLADDLSKGKPGTVGILFSTNITEELQTLFNIPETLHSPIRYYMAPLNTSERAADTAAFSDFLSSKVANRIMEQHGFLVVAH